MNWLALDIGGANIKAADGRGFALGCAFPLWKQPQRLAAELRRILAESPPSDHVVATMTGELADCFATKRAGVLSILDALQEAVDGRHTRVYALDGALLTPLVAGRRYGEVAAANWHALARYAGRFLGPGPGLMLDIGSTTCDLIPFHDGRPQPAGLDDTRRLMAGELVYTGIQRSPLCAIARQVPYRGQFCPVAQELFATTLDAYLVLGLLPEDSSSTLTADGRPATKACAVNRLARSLCADEEIFQEQDAIVMAEAIQETQVELLLTALERMLPRWSGETPATVVVSGHGEFLGRRVMAEFAPRARIVSLREELGASVSRCATAHALAVLACEMTDG